jgi:DNA polymerase III subunit epsilon
MNYTVIDVETASHQPGSICRVGLIVVRGGQTLIEKAFYLDPGCSFDPAFTRLHGVSERDTDGQPTFARFHKLLSERLRGETMVSHGAFDSTALAAAASSAGVALPPMQWVDTVVVARRAWPEMENHKLPTLARHLNVSLIHHDPLEDARACNAVLCAALPIVGGKLEDWHRDRVAKPQKHDWASKKVRHAEVDVEGPLFPKTVVFTGELTVARQVAIDAAAKTGLLNRSSVTDKTDIVVLGSAEPGKAASAKAREAERRRAAGQLIQILDEAGFRQLLASAGVQLE